MALPRVEADHVVAANLVDEELALLVADVVVAKLRAVGDLEVVRRARRDRGLVVRVANVGRARRDLVIVRVGEAKIDDAGRRHRVDRAVRRLDERFRIGDVALDSLAIAPDVVVRDEAERAEAPCIVLGQEPAVAERDLEAAVGTQVLAFDLDVAVQRKREIAIDGFCFAQRVRRAVAVQSPSGCSRG